jgi:GntR family transcriptional regulator, rspAB operon transcriptional repressor
MDHEPVIDNAGSGDNAGPGRRTRRAYLRLRSMIFEGGLQAGTVLNEGRLAEELGMSKTPVRAALRTLRHEGLLERGPRRQMVVRDLPPSSRQELLQVREALERIVVEHACEVMPREQLDYVWTILRRQKRAAEDGLVSEFVRLDEEMHLALATQSGLQFVPRLLNQLRGFVSLMRLNTRRDPGYLMRVLEEHQRILDAIESRNAPAALKALTVHLHTNEYIVIDEASPDGGPT